MNNNAKGIDVSSYQALIDWKKVKASGIDFAIIRAGWGWTHIDSSFLRNIKEALEAGLEVGAYWFIYASSEAEVKKNAETFDKTIAEFKNKITVKVWADWEGDSDTNYKKVTGKTLTKAQRTSFVRLFLETMKAKGYDVGLYANPDYLKNKFNDLSEYPLWLAHYSKTMGNYPALIWQYSSAGTVEGIKGNVDSNTYLGGEVKQTVSEVPKEEPKATGKTYIVKAGDTLSKIAKQYKTTVDALMKINPQIKNKNLIDIGQPINVDVPEQTSKGFKAKVTAKALNIRKKPSIVSERIGSLFLNEIVEVESEEGNWGKLKGREGYINLSWVKKI